MSVIPSIKPLSDKWPARPTNDRLADNAKADGTVNEMA